MRSKLTELTAIYLIFPLLFTGGLLRFEQRFIYFALVFIIILIQTIRYRKQIRFQFKDNLKESIYHGIKFSLISFIFIYPINLFMNIRMFNDSSGDQLLFIFLYYPFISAPLQEYFFRTYFYARFKGIKKPLLFWINIFSFAYFHLMYGGWLAVYLSFISGLIINLNYQRYKNDFTIIFIHALQGVLIFLMGYLNYFTDFFK